MKPIIFYAHHLWKYGTQKEIDELCVIKKHFKDSVIINPNGWINQCGDEKYITGQCLKLVEVSDVLVFSALQDNVIGKGVYSEIETALNKGKKVFFLCDDILIRFGLYDFKSIEILRNATDRRYAQIN